MYHFTKPIITEENIVKIEGGRLVNLLAIVLNDTLKEKLGIPFKSLS